MQKILNVRQVDANYGSALFNGHNIETPLNEALCELQEQGAEIAKITYISNTRTGEIKSAIIEYYTDYKNEELTRE